MLLNAEGTIGWISSTLSEQELKMLSDNIEALLIHDQKETVGQTLCFSRNLSVQGFYRHKDVFQILPIPTEAPHAPATAADHPFILQFKYVHSPDRGVDSKRRVEKAAKLTQILNVLCSSHIFLRSQYVRFFWSTPYGE